MSRGSGIGAGLGGKSRLARRSRTAVVTFAAMCALIAALPAWADAHGPVAPIATSHLARIASLPSGLAAKVIDGSRCATFVAACPGERDGFRPGLSRGALSAVLGRRGVAVNHNSPMYYLQTICSRKTSSSNLGPHTPPKWSSASAAHAYSWHDGRLHALAAVAIAPGTAYVGRWSIPVQVNGRPGPIAGGLWHAGLIICPLCGSGRSSCSCCRCSRQSASAWPVLNLRLARLLSAGALVGISIAAAGTELHGRPAVSVLQAITLAVVWGFVVWVSRRLLLGRTRYFTWFAIAFVAIWEGAKLIPTLVNGFVLAGHPCLSHTSGMRCVPGLWHRAARCGIDTDWRARP